MTKQQLSEVHELAAGIMRDVGLALHHAEQARDGRTHNWGIAQVAEDSDGAADCAANAADMICLFHGALEKVAVAAAKEAKAAAKKKRRAS